MKWHTHSEIEGQHAFLSASKSYWVNYDIEKLGEAYTSFMAAQRGTELHELAANLIKHKIDLPKTQQTFNMYVNDAILFNMAPERVLYFSENCFGTADAISFWKNTLRIHDLKTGVTPVTLRQLEVYAALFCLEYKKKPQDIDIVLRVYQGDGIQEKNPDSTEIMDIMDKIVIFDKEIEKMKSSMNLDN